MTYNFVVGPSDTDSISFCKLDMSPFSQQEIDSLIREINDISPEYMVWENDGVYKKCIAFKAKNYILWDGVKTTIKGSALKDAKSPKAIKEFQRAIVDSMLHEKNDYLTIYHQYVKDVWGIQTQEDIKKWSAKYTISDKTLNSERTNETKVVDAFAGTEYVEGDRIWLFFKNDKSLCLVERFSGDYDKYKLLEKLYNSSEIFANVIGNDLFPNYSLVKNREALHNILELVYEKPTRKKK